MIQNENSLIEYKLASIEPFVKKIIQANSIDEKLQIVSLESSVEAFLNKNFELRSLMKNLDSVSTFTIKLLIALGQGSPLFTRLDTLKNKDEALHQLINHLMDVEKHYAFMGGLAGYYLEVIKLIAKNQDFAKSAPKSSFRRPPGLDLSTENAESLTAFRWGIENLPKIAQICPLGGAGDRLNLKDEISGDPLPAAELNIGGFSLLEGLIRDLQAQEFLYWKIFDQQLTIPLAMMTSKEKNNDAHIASTFSKKNYFGRSQESFRRFIQPLVPVITENGDFAVSTPMQLGFKPGGHGMLWKLAFEDGTLAWFRSLGREKMSIRQINNPIAAVDMAFLAFLGIGCKKNKSFGFLSCGRLQNTAEGMLVLRETPSDTGFSYSISNIEYTDSSQKEIEKSSSEGISQFPTNTNILFADLNDIETLVKQLPLPGMIINMKSKVSHLNEEGKINEPNGGRLESMMQNISDILVDQFQEKLDDETAAEKLHCFVAYGERQKTISVTKNPYIEGKLIAETPEGCFYDQMANARKLLVDRCNMNLPLLSSPEKFAKQGPPFIVRYHPALGPTYHVIAQKIRGGILNPRAELILEITELDLEDLKLEGSLHIVAKDLLGHQDDQGVIQYSKQNGKCELKNVTVKNRGINREANNSFWEDKISHHEKLEIILHGNGEFYACDVCLEGNQRIEVPSGERLEITMEKGQVVRRNRKIATPTWHWNYAFNEGNSISVLRQSSST